MFPEIGLPCWWGFLEITIDFVWMCCLVGLFYLNYKNRKIAKQALIRANEIGKHAANVHAMVDHAVGQPPPPSLPDPEEYTNDGR
jgi:hypothetical protein